MAEYAMCTLCEGDVHGVVALPWYYPPDRGARRRNMFPSWSPIGWTADAGEPKMSFNGFIDIDKVMLWTEQGTGRLPALVPELGKGLANVPRYLL